MMISAVFIKKKGLIKQDERLHISLNGDPEIVSKEYNEFKEKFIKLGYEVE